MIRILLADDHPIVRRGVRALLETRTDFVVCAETGEGREAVALALWHKPEVAIVDVSLPGLNGIEVTRQIRKACSATEVLVFTMHSEDALVMEIVQAGARGYLLKQDADRQIIDAVAALARHRPFFAQAVSEAMLDRFRSGSGARALTARETEVVRLISEGQSNKNIAYLLDLSTKTVEAHRAAAMRKLDLHSTAALVRYAIRNKLVEP